MPDLEILPGNDLSMIPCSSLALVPQKEMEGTGWQVPAGSSLSGGVAEAS